MTIKITRRAVLGAPVALWATASFADTQLEEIGNTLSVEDAYELALDGAITLVDIRRPDEWALTGVGEGATPLDMRRKDFLTELDKLVGADRAKPVALICARGVRSKWLSKQLANAGFTRVIDVPEGMLGSRAGPGWVRIGLPVEKI